MAIGGGIAGLGYSITIKDNSGAAIITVATSTEQNVTVTEDGLVTAIAENLLYSYKGNGGTGQFLGFATTANATIPDYIIGSSITLSAARITLYVVEMFAAKYKVKYKNIDLATLEEGKKLTIKCKEKIMLGDVVIERI